MKFNESRNQEIKFKQYSWEKKKTIKDIIANRQKQTIQMHPSNNLLEDYLRRNPHAKVQAPKAKAFK
mgnify:CR=1 FL=1